MTSSMRDVQPVAQWDDLDLPGAAGPIAQRLTQIWATGAGKGIDP